MIPLLPIYLLLVTIALSLACIVSLHIPGLSQWIPALTFYGKATKTLDDPFFKALQVPKKWFRHFYILAVINTTFWIIFPFWTHSKLFEYLTPASGHIPLTTTSLVLILVFIHTARRCYETQFISIYSDSKMNIGHYTLGMIHYSILPLTFACETEAFRTGNFVHKEITSFQWLGVFLFFFSNYNQHMVARQMAASRRSNSGKVSAKHNIIRNGWFEFVSSPHFFFEICIYISFWLIVPNNIAYLFMLLFVIVNQMFAGILTHQWYLENFKNYPKNRKAIIPYLI